MWGGWHEAVVSWSRLQLAAPSGRSPFAALPFPSFLSLLGGGGDPVVTRFLVPLYLRLTWKCEVGAQLGLKRLIWG